MTKTIKETIADAQNLIDEIERAKRRADLPAGSNHLVLRWDSIIWKSISWNHWSAFRNISAEFKALQGVPAGVHYFVVIYFEDSQVFNIIPHRYKTDQEGKITGSGFDVLSRAERLEYNRIELLLKPSPNELDALEKMRAKVYPEFLPPKDSVIPLIQALPGYPLEGKPAWRFLEDMGAPKPISIAKN